MPATFDNELVILDAWDLAPMLSEMADDELLVKPFVISNGGIKIDGNQDPREQNGGFFWTFLKRESDVLVHGFMRVIFGELRPGQHQMVLFVGERGQNGEYEYSFVCPIKRRMVQILHHDPTSGLLVSRSAIGSQTRRLNVTQIWTHLSKWGKLCKRLDAFGKPGQKILRKSRLIAKRDLDYQINAQILCVEFLMSGFKPPIFPHEIVLQSSSETPESLALSWPLDPAKALRPVTSPFRRTASGKLKLRASAIARIDPARRTLRARRNK